MFRTDRAMKLDHFDFGARYHVGVPEIDRQHTTFFDIYNDIAARVNTNEFKTNRAFQGVGNQLFMYARYHFREEQWIMSSFEYPDLRMHFDQHHYLRSYLDSVPLTTASPDKVLKIMTDFVQLWADHILTSDLALGAYMQRRI